MSCHWCGSYRGVKPVRRDGKPIVSPIRGESLRLCFTCWGVFAESGQRKDQTGRPSGLAGVPMTPAIVRALARH